MTKKEQIDAAWRALDSKNNKFYGTFYDAGNMHAGGDGKWVINNPAFIN
jgi:hypothetical protein